MAKKKEESIIEKVKDAAESVVEKVKDIAEEIKEDIRDVVEGEEKPKKKSSRFVLVKIPAGYFFVKHLIPKFSANLFATGQPASLLHTITICSGANFARYSAPSLTNLSSRFVLNTASPSALLL